MRLSIPGAPIDLMLNKLSAVIGLVAGTATLLIATPDLQVSLFGIAADQFEPILIGFITALVGILFPKLSAADQVDPHP